MTNLDPRKLCDCARELKPGMVIKVDSFNPLICADCKGYLDYGEKLMSLDPRIVELMPKPMQMCDHVIGGRHVDYDYMRGANKMRDDCLNALSGKVCIIPSEKQLYKVIERIYLGSPKEIKEVAQAILALLKENV